MRDAGLRLVEILFGVSDHEGVQDAARPGRELEITPLLQSFHTNDDVFEDLAADRLEVRQQVAHAFELLDGASDIFGVGDKRLQKEHQLAGVKALGEIRELADRVSIKFLADV